MTIYASPFQINGAMCLYINLLLHLFEKALSIASCIGVEIQSKRELNGINHIITYLWHHSISECGQIKY